MRPRATDERPKVEFVMAWGSEVGLGHVVRCAALSEALRRLGAVTVVRPLDVEVPSGLDSRFDGMASPSDPPALCTVVDLPDGVPSVSGVGRVVAVLHDGPAEQLDVDVVVNPNLTATALGYRVRSGGQVFAGARHALVEPTVREARRLYSCPDGAVRRILITCGAADPAGVSELVIRALAPLAAEVDVAVLVGPLNPRVSAIEALATAAGVRTIQGSSVASEALGCELAITTLGVTASELACMGVPNLAIAHSAVQLPFLAAYAEAGFVRAVGSVDDITEEDIARVTLEMVRSAGGRREIYRRSRQLVDGQGADRVARGLFDRLAR